MGAEERTLRAIEMTRIVLERARCPGCQWTGRLRELRCGGCHGRRLFKWTGEAWSCTRCGHVRGDQSPPRALDGYEASEPRGPQPDGVETPPHRGPLGRREAAGVILEAIPRDSWVSAVEISAETGMSSLKVAGIIRGNLLGVDVERRSMRPSRCRSYLYRRLRYVDASKRPPDS